MRNDMTTGRNAVPMKFKFCVKSRFCNSNYIMR